MNVYLFIQVDWPFYTLTRSGG